MRLLQLQALRENFLPRGTGQAHTVYRPPKADLQLYLQLSKLYVENDLFCCVFCDLEMSYEEGNQASVLDSPVLDFVLTLESRRSRPSSRAT